MAPFWKSKLLKQNADFCEMTDIYTPKDGIYDIYYEDDLWLEGETEAEYMWRRQIMPEAEMLGCLYRCNKEDIRLSASIVRLFRF